MYEKFKPYLHDDSLFVACLVLLVGVISFNLGKQSAVVENNLVSSHVNDSGVIFFDNTETKERTNSNDVSQIIEIIASKSGAKFHLPDCPGASQIKESNIIYFDSIELARAAGYSPAANCPGLQ